MEHRPCLVSVYGPAGAGKSTLTKAMVALLGDTVASRVPADYFLLPRDAGAWCRSGPPYQYDWPLLAATLAAPLGSVATTPAFDFATFARRPSADQRTFVLRPVMLIDAMYPYPGADLSIQVTAPAACRRARISTRDQVWRSEVAARWDSLEAARAWLDTGAPTADLTLSGEAPAAENAARVGDLIAAHRYSAPAHRDVIVSDTESA